MSDSSHETNHPIGSIIGTAFLFFVPGVMIVMLGVFGIAFFGGMGEDEVPETAASMSAPPAPIPATTPAPAPAATSSDAATGQPAPPAGGTTAAVSTGDAGGGIDPALMEAGKKAYATCAACHGPDGQGIQVGPAKMAPTLTGSELLMGDPDKALLILLKGIAKENMDYMGVMASLGAALDDQKMAAVLTYTRNAFGNNAPPVTVEQAAEARAKFSDVDAPAGVKRSEIPEIVAAHE